MKNNIHGFADRQLSYVKPCRPMLCFIQTLPRRHIIVSQRYDPCEFPGFVWTDCWGNKSCYVITSPANCHFSSSHCIGKNCPSSTYLSGIFVANRHQYGYFPKHVGNPRLYDPKNMSLLVGVTYFLEPPSQNKQ